MLINKPPVHISVYRRFSFYLLSAAQFNAMFGERINGALHGGVSLFIRESAVMSAHLDVEGSTLLARRNLCTDVDVEELDRFQDLADSGGNDLFEPQHRQINVADKREVAV